VKRPWAVALVVGGVVFVASAISLPMVSLRVQRGPGRVPIGKLNNIAIYGIVSNVAIPNAPVPGKTGSYAGDPRTSGWDAYVTSAPVPETKVTSDGISLTVPWTRLPGSIVETVDGIDPEFGQMLQRWLFLREGPSTWTFGRVSRLQVSAGPYRDITGMNAVYGVNLFDFLQDLGGDYQASLKAAVVSAAKLAVEDARPSGDQRLAFPAIAGAAFVEERELVLTYRDSFDAILTGIGDAQGRSPAQITLVIWNSLANRPVELKAALDGLEHAAYRRVTSLHERLVLIAAVATAFGLIVGVAFGFYRRRHSQRLAVVVTSVVALMVSAGQYRLVTFATDFLPITSFPPVDITVLSVAAALLGLTLESIGYLTLGKNAGSASG
jgi:hypothetical protein